MKVYEYQAKELLGGYGIPVPRGAVAATAEEAVAAAKALDGSAWVVKAQIHAGGRRRGRFDGSPAVAGGIRFVGSLEEVGENAGQMLGQVLVTEQTGSAGRRVKQVYVEAAHEVQRELYLGMLVDRRTSRVTLIALAEGGVDIEALTRHSPDSLIKVAIDPLVGLSAESAHQVAAGLGLAGDQAQQAVRIMLAVYDMFMRLDASLIEINPLAITSAGDLLALDATVTFDDNALFRHQDIEALRDEDELQWGELDATRHGLNYVKLDGNIGCLSSGAGLAMATLDAIKLYGGEAANFLDVPPGVQVERVRYAFELILSDPSVETILVNVFGGGIMRCDTIADGMILASREVPPRVPLIVRLAGVNAEFARLRLKDSGLAVTFADDLAEAAEKAVAAARAARLSAQRSWWQRVQGLMTKQDESGERLTRYSRD